jgi:hypothetical protein
MHAEVRIPSPHQDRVAGREPGKGTFHEYVGAPVETKFLKVDNRPQR